MKTLNLVNIEASDISYQVSQFPDGQQNITIDLNSISHRKYFIKVEQSGGSGYENKIIPIIIKSRLNNWLDLELIATSVASLRELGVKEIHLYVPYVVGARSDRKFEAGGNNYLRDVICPIINSLKFESVTVIDPHSDVLEACIKGFRKKSNDSLVIKALRDWEDLHNETYGNSTKRNPPTPEDKFILVSPDAGASKKIYKIAEQIGYKGDIITCSKDRDVDGKLTRTVVPWKEGQLFDKDIIIIDDICDGGRTFINISEVIKNKSKDWKYEPKIYLIVTHGIFSKGLKELNQYFDGIYCTNSYSDMNDTAFSLANDNQMYKLKQLNVF